MEDKVLNGEESLELISQMIKNTRTKFEKGGGKIFLIWGYTTLFVSALVFTLLTITDNYAYSWFWFLIPVLGVPLNIYYNKSVKVKAKTYLDGVISKLWITLGIVAFMTPIVAMFKNYGLPILMIEGLVINIGLTVTSLYIGSKVSAVAGVLGIILSYSTLFVVGYTNTIIIFAAMSIVSMIIPGHYLSIKCKK